MDEIACISCNGVKVAFLKDGTRAVAVCSECGARWVVPKGRPAARVAPTPSTEKH